LQTNSRSYYWVGATLVLLSAFCFALKGIFIKMAYHYHLDTITVLTLRMIFASPFYLLMAIKLHLKEKSEQSVSLTTPLWLWVAGLGITGYYLASFFDFLSLQYISASLERVFLFVYPTFVLAINAIFRKRKPSKLQLFALSLTYFGILMAFVENIGSVSQKNLWLGTFWVMFSGLVYSFYLVGGESIIPKVGTQKFTIYAMLFATVPIIGHCWLVNDLKIWNLPSQVYWICGSMAVVSTVIPTFMMSEGIQRIGAGNTAIVGSIGPIFTIALATTFLGENITLLQISGTILVLLGVLLIGWKGKKQ
jgi:drug/metabolite transporter (DMT)-like permease